MTNEFNGFTKGIVGNKLPADTTLNNMKRSELIELLHIAQNNYDALMQTYTNAVNVNIEELAKCGKEIRDKAIDEFAKKIKEATYYWFMTGTIAVGMIDEIAEQMKEVEE